MNKKEIKDILISMRTPDNENIINNLLGKLDLLSDENLNSMVTQIGDNEESIRKYLQKKLHEKQEHGHEEHTPINNLFSYGISGGCIHLHLPVDLHQMMSEKGIFKTIDFVNLKLLDAIEKIRKLYQDGYYRFEGTNNIYMISPILIKRETDFLQEIDFKTQIYKRQHLQDPKFVNEHPEAQLAIQKFGKNSNVGTAIIGLDIINSSEWEKKRKEKIEEFKKKGISLDLEEKDKNN